MKTGVAFPDYILTGESRKKKSYDRKDDSLRPFFLSICVLVVTLVVLGRIFYLQIIKGDYYKNLSNNNRIKTVVIHAERGIIFDRNGTPLVFNVPGFRKTENGKTKLISNDDAMTLIAKGENLEVDHLRSYPYKDEFSHVLGYLGEIGKNDLSKPEFSDYASGDFIGKTGVEQEYEHFLKGIDGKELIEIDSMGKQIRKLGKADPVAGRNINLTLDIPLQRAAFSAMQNIKRGAVIATTPTGEILSMVSKPSFDPNLFTMGEGYAVATGSASENLNRILLDSQSQPLLNRSIAGLYPPGSTFKLVVASAGLQNGIIDESYTVNDTGILNVGAFSFSNWYFSQYSRTEGEVNVVKGIKRSNDIFFYKLAEKVGVDKISDTAVKFGLGKKLGIDLAGEVDGTVPTPSWKEKEIGEPWYLGDTYHYGIGQGYLLTTPLQVNGWTQAISNAGTLYRPHLLENQSPVSISQNLLSKENFSLIRQGMIEACSTGGVAWPLFDFQVKNPNLRIDGKNFLEVPTATISASFKDYRKVTVACKTGTAQHGGADTLPHAWITLFAPAYNPQIVVTVLAEESGEGSNIAAPVAKKILEEWFSR